MTNLQLQHKEAERWFKANPGRRVVLSLSLGKDSIAAALVLKRYIFNLKAIFFAQLWDRKRDKEYIAYLEDKLGITVETFPHPILLQYLEKRAYFKHDELIDPFGEEGESVDRFPPIAKDSDRYLFDIVEKYSFGRAKEGSIAVGIKRCDSPSRAIGLNQCGFARSDNSKIFPVSLLTHTDCFNLVKAAGVKLSLDSKKFGSNFDSHSFRYWVRAFHEDKETWHEILRAFPLAGALVAKDRFRRIRWITREQ